MATENVLPLLLVFLSSKDNIVHKLSHHAETPARKRWIMYELVRVLVMYWYQITSSSLQKKWFSQKL